MLWKSLLDILFPVHCLGCKEKRDGILCQRCFSQISVNKTFFCGKCRLRLADGKRVCHKDFPFLLGAATSYSNDLVKKLIRLLKFNFVKDAAVPLGDILRFYVSKSGFELKNFVVVPIPLSAKRLRERGFNQSELVAKNFAESLGLEINTAAFVRIKNSKPQSEARDTRERMEGVRGCFIVKNESLAGKNILLVDDVITSGSTMTEAAKTLKSAGARKIIALAVAMA